MNAEFEKVRAHYMKFPDKSDFVPVEEDEKIKFFYSDEHGLQKAKFMSFSLGISPDYEYAEKKHILEILESFGGEVDDVTAEESDDIEDDANILTSSYDDAPVIRLVNQIIISAVKNGASDIHFEIQKVFMTQF